MKNTTPQTALLNEAEDIIKGFLSAVTGSDIHRVNRANKFLEDLKLHQEIEDKFSFAKVNELNKQATAHLVGSENRPCFMDASLPKGDR